MRVNAFLACRMGSTRIPFKNVRLLNGKPMFEYLLDTSLRVKRFTRLFINSDSQLILDIARERYLDAVSYYKRSEELGTSAATLDEYVYDFMKEVSGDITVFLNPCSIFLSAETISNAVDYFIANDLDSCVASAEIRTHCFFENSPVNFSFDQRQPRSQDLPGVHAMTSGFFIWRNSTFTENYLRDGFANFSGKFSSYGLSMIEAIDIDTEEDFLFAEYLSTRSSGTSKPVYHRRVQDDIMAGNIKVN